MIRLLSADDRARVRERSRERLRRKYAQAWASFIPEVSQDDHRRIRARLRRRLERPRSGFDAELAWNGALLVRYHLQADAWAFRDISGRVLADLGETARLHLPHWYNAVRDFPGARPVTVGMDSRDAVDTWMRRNDPTG